ncbi:PEP-CTERM sorting domain-containing protein [Undibacterium sp. TJN25]|uniref:PEP-CTERM sorting domain-containing protein n=1 Tax=Undibacterium sp. TJN25 TaxID=3413056 RepID=UPI003BF02DAB
MKKLSLALAIALMSTGSAFASPFVNGGFEDGNTSGWTTGAGYRGNTLNAGMTPDLFLPSGALYNASYTNHSSLISAGTVDPILGGLLGSTVYNGNYSYRAEDTTSGGYASVISQKVTNYTDANIFFAWKAVLENGGHSDDESALMMIVLHDDTNNTDVIRRVYNAGDGGGGVDGRFSSSGDFFYTSQWQLEQLNIDASLSGHDFTLSLLAADCNPTAHTGYAYLDGFGAVLPPADVPEPMSIALFGLGLTGMAAVRRRKKK